MKVRVIKQSRFLGNQYEKGQVIEVNDLLARKLMSIGNVELYTKPKEVKELKKKGRPKKSNKK